MGENSRRFYSSRFRHCRSLVQTSGVGDHIRLRGRHAEAAGRGRAAGAVCGCAALPFLTREPPVLSFLLSSVAQPKHRILTAHHFLNRVVAIQKQISVFVTTFGNSTPTVKYLCKDFCPREVTGCGGFQTHTERFWDGTLCGC